MPLILWIPSSSPSSPPPFLLFSFLSFLLSFSSPSSPPPLSVITVTCCSMYSLYYPPILSPSSLFPSLLPSPHLPCNHCSSNSSLVSAALGSQIRVADRPVTQQGLGGMKTGARGRNEYFLTLTLILCRSTLILGPLLLFAWGEPGNC